MGEAKNNPDPVPSNINSDEQEQEIVFQATEATQKEQSWITETNKLQQDTMFQTIEKGIEEKLPNAVHKEVQNEVKKQIAMDKNSLFTVF